MATQSAIQTKETKPAYDGSPLRLLQQTRISFNSQSWIAEAGTVFEDYPLCSFMWAHNYPVIAASAGDMVQCQKCQHLFDASINEYTGTVLIYLKDTTYWYNGSTVKRVRGELELDSFLQRHCIDTKQQIAIAGKDEYSHCPACNNISVKEKLLGDRSKPLALPTPPAQAVAAAPATATLAAVETPSPPPSFVDPLTQPMSDLPIEERLEKRFGGWE